MFALEHGTNTSTVAERDARCGSSPRRRLRRYTTLFFHGLRLCNCSEYVYEDCSVSSAESTLVDDEWDDRPYDDCIFGWCATIVFEDEAHHRKARMGCGGRLCRWDVCV